jgi:mono/diheme cytochrome c family protein
MMRRAMVAGALAAFAAAGPLGCRGDVSDRRPRQFFPDLDDQYKMKPQTETAFFEEYASEDGVMVGRSARLPAPGTVPFGARPLVSPIAGVDFAARGEFLRDDPATTMGRVYVNSAEGGFLRDEETGGILTRYIETIPVDVDMELLALGQKKYNIYCLPCHGGTGHGDGLVGTRWSYTLPNFHDEKYQRGGELGQDGYLFHVIRNGIPNPGGSWSLRMPAYGRKLTLEETWAIVAYFRALQRAESASPADLDASGRTELESRRVGSAPGRGPGLASGAAPGLGKEGSS